MMNKLILTCSILLLAVKANSQDDNLEDKLRGDNSGPELPTIDNIV